MFECHFRANGMDRVNYLEVIRIVEQKKQHILPFLISRIRDLPLIAECLNNSLVYSGHVIMLSSD